MRKLLWLFISCFADVIEENGDGTEVFVTRFASKRGLKLRFDQKLVAKAYFQEKEHLLAEFGDKFKDVEYDFFHKFYYPTFLYKDLSAMIGLRPKLWRSKGRYYRHCVYVGPKTFFGVLLTKLHNGLERIIRVSHNHFIFKRARTSVLLFEYQENDFRNSDNFKNIRDSWVCSISLRAGLLQQIKYYLRSDVYLLSASRSSNYAAIHSRDIVSTKLALFEEQHHVYKKSLAGNGFRLFIGIDDPSFIRPFLLALREHNIRTVGIQHGMYSLENYGYDNIELHRPWFDFLIVWDEWSKRAFTKINNMFDEDRVRVGTDFFLERSPPSGHKVTNVRNTVFLCGEENVISTPLEQLKDDLFEKGYKLISLQKGGAVGKDKRLHYLHNLRDCDFNECCIIVATKTSLAHKLSRLGVPVLILRSEEGYLWNFLKHNADESIATPPDITDWRNYDFFCYQSQKNAGELNFLDNLAYLCEELPHAKY